MWKIIVFILLFPFNSIAQDALLEAMFKNWKSSPDELEEPAPFYLDETDPYQNTNYSDSWELGTPDNIPEIEIIYEDPNPCRY
jgi:hypothetical protein